MDLNEKLTRRCAEQSDENAQIHDEISVLRNDYEKEKQVRRQFEIQLNEVNKLMEKVFPFSTKHFSTILSLQDHSKRLQKLRNYASLADDEGDIVVSSSKRRLTKNSIVKI